MKMPPKPAAHPLALSITSSNFFEKSTCSLVSLRLRYNYLKVHNDQTIWCLPPI